MTSCLDVLTQQQKKSNLFLYIGSLGFSLLLKRIREEARAPELTLLALFSFVSTSNKKGG
jgi:hypothetical protein